MRKIGIVAMAIIMMGSSMGASAQNTQYRTMVGKYYDYMVVETRDGREWMLPDDQRRSNPYMKRVRVKVNGKRKWEYVSKFKPGQKVVVKFDTQGTKYRGDDVIVSVRKK